MSKPEVLVTARAAQLAITELEEATEEAKARFATLTRRAYLEGSSLRAIARELNLSHQRIHQLVEIPRRAGRWRRPGRVPDGGCAFCGGDADRSEQVAGAGVMICRSCVATATRLLDDDGAADDGELTRIAPGKIRCSFCGARGRRAVRSRRGAGECICEGCVELSREIVGAS